MLRRIWSGWRAVGDRYFQVCSRPALHEQEQTLDVLILHMTDSARTLHGLLQFLPRYGRRWAPRRSAPAPAS
jgi:hypothetical protein